MALTLHATMWMADGAAWSTENPIQDEVVGLPTSEHVLIGKMPIRWHVLRGAPGSVWGEDDYATAEEALAALTKTLKL